MSVDLIDPLKSDFRNFLYVVWKHLGLPEPTRAQYALAYYLQHSPKRFIMAAFRGIGKSYITVAYVCWRLYCDPQTKIMVVSAAEDRAIQFSIFVKALINDMEILNFLKPKRGQRDSNLAFDVGPATASGSPSVKSVGITGQLTGSRADLIIGDDIEIPKNSATNDMREKLAELVKEFAAVLTPKQDSKIVYLGTPQTEMSLYNLLETRGYTMRIWCARYPTELQAATYGARLTQEIMDDLADGAVAGTSTDPKRFSDEDLLEREGEYGRSGFALQFMLDTTLSDANKYPLKINDLVVANCPIAVAPNQILWSNSPLLKLTSLPNVAMAGQHFYASEALTGVYSPYQSSMLAIDPSGRGEDELAFAVAKMQSGNVFIPKAGGMQGGYSDENLIALCHIAKEYKVNEIVVESNFGKVIAETKAL